MHFRRVHLRFLHTERTLPAQVQAPTYKLLSISNLLQPVVAIPAEGESAPAHHRLEPRFGPDGKLPMLW